jgi:signal transduction histidine kinase
MFNRAELYLDSAKILSKECGDMSLMVENLKYQAELAYGRGNDRAAYLAIIKRNELNDSLFSTERAEQITQLNTAYEAESKQAEIDLLQKGKEVADAQKDQFRYISIVLTVAFVLLVLLLLVVIRRIRERTRNSRELIAKNREIERQQVEILEQNDALSVQNKRLAELNREKDGLIWVVAHDIRAPLNRSAALAELIAAVGPLNAEQRKFAEMIGKVSEEGGRLIQDLLELNAYERDDARIDFMDKDVNEVLDHCANGFYSQSSAKNISLHLQLLSDVTIVKTDEKLLSRVLDNLLSNAIKFTHPGKNIFLSAKVVDQQVLLEVKDEGQGISTEDRRKMFQKFQRLSARPTGGESSTGLGLSIVKTLVKRLKGHIEVESEVGKGSTFTLRLPLVEVEQPVPLVGK